MNEKSEFQWNLLSPKLNQQQIDGPAPAPTRHDRRDRGLLRTSSYRPPWLRAETRKHRNEDCRRHAFRGYQCKAIWRSPVVWALDDGKGASVDASLVMIDVDE